MPGIPSVKGGGQEGQYFKVILGYTMSLRSSRVTDMKLLDTTGHTWRLVSQFSQ